MSTNFKDGDKKMGEQNRRNTRFSALKNKKLIWLGILICIIAAGVFIYFHYLSGRVYTDDAFIRGHVSPVSPKIDGTVRRVLVKDNEWVNEGQKLVILDDSSRTVNLEKAKAELEMAKAKVEKARSAILMKQKALDVAEADLTSDKAEFDRITKDLERYRNLVKKNEVSQQQYESKLSAYISAKSGVYADEKRIESAKSDIKLAEAELKVAVSDVNSSRAGVDDADLNLGYTVITAPVSGRVTEKTVEEGQVVHRGQPLLALVKKDLWVIANFKETQITHMKLNQEVEIEVDAYPDHKFRGHIDSFQYGSGAAFSLLPPENATGNYVKVTQRIPVKIVFDDLDEETLSKYVLGPGMSVVPTVLIGPG